MGGCSHILMLNYGYLRHNDAFSIKNVNFFGKLDIPGFRARKWLAIAEFSKFSKIFFGFDIVA